MLSEGTRVGNYIVGAFIGSGGMSSVYRARHAALNSEHAIKVLEAGFGRQSSLRERFLQEGRVLAQVRHPALVRVTDVIDEGDLAALVMDLLEGEDLAHRLMRGPLSVPEAAAVALQALAAMEHAHGNGIIHRDVKPANVFLVARGKGRGPQVKVLDFGIAKLAGSERTHNSATMGTVSYMSPEQIENPASVDARTDVFSLGVVLYEMVSGKPAFGGDTDYAVMKRIVEGVHPELPPSAGALDGIVRRAMQPHPGDRYGSANEFAAALRPLAPPEVRLMVDDWEGSGTFDPDVPARRPGPVTSQAAPPAGGLPMNGEQPIGFQAPILDPVAAVTDEERRRMTHAEVVRLTGIMQLTSGVFNVCVMSIVQCFGLGWLGGLPACFGGLLLVVGLAEILSGLTALSSGSPRWIRPIALLEVVALAGGGVISALVGMAILFVRKRYPLALP